MPLIKTLKTKIAAYLRETYGWDGDKNKVELEYTRKEFEGEFTFVCFPYLSLADKAPEKLATEIGEFIKAELQLIEDFNVLKGFLNLKLKNSAWYKFTLASLKNGLQPSAEVAEKIMVEYCSPNTNKPLHLGHIRNILLGDSVSRILEAVGHEVIHTQVINDRGIAISKSMIAWLKWGNGETPETTGMKGDHFVGEYYVKFNKELDKEYEQWQESASSNPIIAGNRRKNEALDVFFKRFKNTYFNKYSELGRETIELLKKWENADDDIYEIWYKMNAWVLDGFKQTFESLEVGFDKNYLESDTYLVGKEVVKEGLEKNIFVEEDDGSICIDLRDMDLGNKILMRADGTSLYITQDLGTARLRFEDYSMDRMIYVVGDEQEYHFQVLFELLKRLDAPYADELYHLAYGMVDLPSGKMKSREGNVVDADDLIAEVIAEARKNAGERGELSNCSVEEKEEIIRNVGMAALKFYILQVSPRRRMVFDPEESVDLQGHTGPYIQNAYVRIRSLLRKQKENLKINKTDEVQVGTDERSLLMKLHATSARIEQAAEQYDPSQVADQAYSIAKAFHKFYHEVPILRAPDMETKAFRIALCKVTAMHLKYLFNLMNVEMPTRM